MTQYLKLIFISDQCCMAHTVWSLPYFGSNFVKHGPFWSILVLFGHFSPVWSMIDRQSRSVSVSFGPLRPITVRLVILIQFGQK